ncbi:MAG: hypothetical protein OXD50_04515 [Chloroflexi bacterium]|nr:hypothetical protein [Chloroflexota bacterium]
MPSDKLQDQHGRLSHLDRTGRFLRSDARYSFDRWCWALLFVVSIRYFILTTLVSLVQIGQHGSPKAIEVKAPQSWR